MTPAVECEGRLNQQRVEALIERVRPLVMPPVSCDALLDLANLIQTILLARIPGDIVQCGVWKGGAGFLMAAMLQECGDTNRRVWLCDSFEGMPPAEPIDGENALRHFSDPASPLHPAASAIPVSEVQRYALDLGLASSIRILKGWFDDTLPQLQAEIGSIALLHIDCDWYASVHCCLDHLYDRVSEGGFVVLDDYYYYDGCAIAVHEFLAGRQEPVRIESVTGRWGGCEYLASARIRKGGTHWQWDLNTRLAALDLERLIPPHASVILVDDYQTGDALTSARPVIRLEAPPSDSAAIALLDRLGADFLVFAWPCFWWLDQYPGFALLLRTRFHCAIDNQRLIAFDLRGAE